MRFYTDNRCRRAIPLYDRAVSYVEDILEDKEKKETIPCPKCSSVNITQQVVETASLKDDVLCFTCNDCKNMWSVPTNSTGRR